MDLIVLVPDRNLEYAVKGILARHQSLGIRPITVEVLSHPGHDPGCFGESPEFLQFAVRQASHALVVFDYEGSGQEYRMNRVQMETDLEQRLSEAGWSGRSAAVIIAPELESWVWSDSPHVDIVLGWEGRRSSLREWLLGQHHMGRTAPKPPHPKDAMLAALREAGKSRTSRLYSALAEKVSLDRCTDDAFLKFKRVLKEWFAEAP
ncbi:MAG: hypothetical protein WCP22_10770 [Chlamydiota bacterium]